jgi:hypothetical protein
MAEEKHAQGNHQQALRQQIKQIIGDEIVTKNGKLQIIEKQDDECAGQELPPAQGSFLAIGQQESQQKNKSQAQRAEGEKDIIHAQSSRWHQYIIPSERFSIQAGSAKIELL